MKDRITISLNSSTIKKVRKIQAEKLAKSTSNVSFSSIAEELVLKGMKK
jgi:hypothetical protein